MTVGLIFGAAMTGRGTGTMGARGPTGTPGPTCSKERVKVMPHLPLSLTGGYGDTQNVAACGVGDRQEDPVLAARGWGPPGAAQTPLFYLLQHSDP